MCLDYCVDINGPINWLSKCSWQIKELSFNLQDSLHYCTQGKKMCYRITNSIHVSENRLNLSLCYGQKKNKISPVWLKARVFACKATYSDLPNNCAVNLIFLRKFFHLHRYTPLLRPTRWLISEIFPSKPDFATYTIIWSYKIICHVRVCR